jgi:hypothetical protein
MAGPTEDVHFGPPFDFPDGDVYLRSADGILFRIHKAVLSATCLTFHEMFASGFAEEHWDSLPVVPLLASEEGIEEVAAFLGIVYSTGSALPGDMDFIRRVLEMGRKYQVDGVRAHCDPALASHPVLRGKPLTFYALACEFRLERTAQVSASECVTQNVDLLLRRQDQLQQLRLLSGEDLYRLYDYRQRCTDTVAMIRDDGTGWNHNASLMRKHEGDTGVEWKHTSSSQCSLEENYHVSDDDSLRPRRWRQNYLRACAEALRTCPNSASVVDVILTGPALTEAQQCPTCGPEALRALHSLSQSLREYFENRFAGVRHLNPPNL